MHKWTFALFALILVAGGGHTARAGGDGGALPSGSPGVTFRNVNKPPAMPSSLNNPVAGRQDEILGAQNVIGNGSATYRGKRVDLRQSTNDDVGLAIPDGANGVVWVPAPAQGPSTGYADARELKLKVRELAAQLIAGMDPSLRGSVALPVSFVSQDDFTQTSALGRFMAEQLFYEFNQRGFPVREYRMADAVTLKEDGEFLLSRAVPAVSVKTPGLVFVAGTYYTDRQAIFINARLIRGTDGRVLRAAQIVLPNSTLTRRMAAGTGKTLKAGGLRIEDFKTVTQPTNLTPIDRGEDIH